MDFRKALWEMVSDLEAAKKQTYVDELIDRDNSHLYKGKAAAYDEVIEYVQDLLFMAASEVEEDIR